MLIILLIVSFLLTQPLGTYASETLPIPNRGMTLSAYVEQLKKAGLKVQIQNETQGDEGYSLETESVILPTGDFDRAFEIAQRILDIPEKIKLPKKSTKPDEKIEIAKNKAWIREIEIKRDKSGSITQVTYYHRGEGGGTTGILLRLGPDRIKFSIIGISD